MTRRVIKIGGAPLRGPMRVLSVALCGVFLIVLARLWHAPPAFEATAVVQIRPAEDAIPVIEARLFGREMLEATAARQGLASGVELTTAVALHPLTTQAGQALGLAPQVIGLVVAVRLSDPGKAVRVANDIALQILDLGQAGQTDAAAEALALFRAEEGRLWQEVAALTSDPGLDAEGRRELALLQAEYDVVRDKLAQEEVRARTEAALRAAPYLLLARAHEAQMLAPPLREALGALAAGALGLALLSSLIGRDLSWPFRSAPSSDSAHNRSS